MSYQPIGRQARGTLARVRGATPAAARAQTRPAPRPRLRVSDFRMQPVVSSNLDAVGYHDETRTLRIRFKNGGTYDYTEVPYAVYWALMRAASKGHFHHAEIKWTYPYRRLPGT